MGIRNRGYSKSLVVSRLSVIDMVALLDWLFKLGWELKLNGQGRIHVLAQEKLIHEKSFYKFHCFGIKFNLTQKYFF